MDNFSERNVRHHFLSREERNIHNRWNREIPPVLRIQSGDLITMEMRDASDGAFSPDSTAAAIAARDTGKIHPLTGPVFIEGAEPGDTLKIDILEYTPGDWGWSVSGPGRGILPELLDTDYFKAWRFDKRSGYAWFNDRVRVKLSPFCGVMGTAPEEAGEFRTMPPHKNGGNMDIRYLTAGTTLYLPVSVSGGLFSAGDGHAAQGDGEVGISAIETEMTVTLRIRLIKGESIEEPRYETGLYYAATGIGTTILEAAQKATGYMVEYICSRWGLEKEEAYVICSAALDLKICETVDLPNYLVAAHLPKEIFLRT
jgi:acetamidase/formamidase